MKKHPCAWLACLVVSAVLVPVWTASAGTSVELRLVDGSRVRVDRIGPETNGRHIALRVEGDRIVLTRLVPWHRVDSACIGNQTFAREILQTYFTQKSQENSPPGDEPGVRLRLLPVRHESAPAGDPFADDGDRAREPSTDFSEKKPAVVPDNCCSPPARPAAAPRLDAVCERCYPILPLEATVIGIRQDPLCTTNVSNFVFLRKFCTRMGATHSESSSRACVGTADSLRSLAVAPELEATVIGIRQDPLCAYRDLLEQHFPDGVPVSETPFVLDMLRAKKDYEVFTAGQPAAKKRVPPQPLPPHRETVQPIRNLTVRALPISEHGKVDWDALSVEVTALDRFGHPTKVRGTLRATLWGRKQQLVSSFGEQFFAKPGRIEKITAWTRIVGSGSPLGQPSRLVLPLPHPLPDHDLRRAAFGELHVQLAVPGEGVFETTERDILLRHRSPLRDRNLVETGSRFFAQESTHGSRMPGGLMFDAPTSLGSERRILTVPP